MNMAHNRGPSESQGILVISDVSHWAILERRQSYDNELERLPRDSGFQER